MGLLKKIASLFGGEGGDNGNVHWEYVRCSRCGEKIAVRVDLRNELTPQWDEGEGAYYTRKGIVGKNAEAIDLDQTAPVITLALLQRLASRDEERYADRLLAVMRNQFGGHAIRSAEEEAGDG